MVHFQLARATAPTRVLITLFLALLLIAYAVATLYALEKTGLEMDGTRLRYQGAGDDEVTEEMHFPISREELLRLTHVHTYGMAMMFYLLGHVFILTQVRPATKVTLLALFFASLLAFVAAPWLVKYVSAGFGALFIGSTAAQWALAAILSGIPVYEMWIARPPDDAGPRREPAA